MSILFDLSEIHIEYWVERTEFNISAVKLNGDAWQILIVKFGMDNATYIHECKCTNLKIFAESLGYFLALCKIHIGVCLSIQGLVNLGTLLNPDV